MTTVLLVVIGCSVLAFFGCFFLALCQDLHQGHTGNDAVEVVRLSERNQERPLERPRSA